MEFETMLFSQKVLWVAVAFAATLCFVNTAVFAETRVPSRRATKAAPRSTKPAPRLRAVAQGKLRRGKAASKTNAEFATVDLSKRPRKKGWDYPYLLAAYGVVWLILMVYLLSLARRMVGTTSELAALEQHVNELSER